jgi:hypothetical protein
MDRAGSNSSQSPRGRTGDKYGLVKVEREFNKSNYITFRNQCCDDMQGQRTGFKTKYYEGFLGYGHWIATTVLFRREPGYEHSFRCACVFQRHEESQFVFATDVIFVLWRALLAKT